MTCGWEGNRRSRVALAMRHRLWSFIHGLDREMSTPPTLSYARFYYRAMLRIRGTSHGPVSVSVSVSVCHKSEFY